MAKFVLNVEGCRKFCDENKSCFATMLLRPLPDELHRVHTALYYIDTSAEKGEESIKYRQNHVSLTNAGTEVVFLDGGEEYLMGTVAMDPTEVHAKGWESMAELCSVTGILDQILAWFCENA